MPLFLLFIFFSFLHFLSLHFLQLFEQSFLLLLAHVLEHLRPALRRSLFLLLQQLVLGAVGCLVHVPGTPPHGQPLSLHLLYEPLLVDVLNGGVSVHSFPIQRAPLVCVHVAELAALDALGLADLNPEGLLHHFVPRLTNQ